jgi:hypothetical protein
MSPKSNFRKQYERAIGLISIIVAFGLSVPSRSVATTWTVTIDLHTENDKPHYDVAKSDNVCTYPIPSDGYILYICRGDTVVWNVKTKTDGDYKLRIFFQHPVLDDDNSVKPALTKWFDGAKGHLTKGGKVDSSVQSDETEEYAYAVSVYDADKPNRVLYLHDPKIIVGTGRTPSPINSLHTSIAEVNQLVMFFKDNSQAAKDVELRKLIEDLNNAVEKLNKQVDFK